MDILFVKVKHNPNFYVINMSFGNISTHMHINAILFFIYVVSSVLIGTNGIYISKLKNSK
jgi:hypothetical protein